MELAMVQCLNRSDRQRGNLTADDRSSAAIRVTGVWIRARGRWITSRGGKIFIAGELDATPASRGTSPLAHHPSDKDSHHC
jgi:hypothetical protein